MLPLEVVVPATSDFMERIMDTPQGEDMPRGRQDLSALEQAKFSSAIGEETDSTMLILRVHLFSENLLERLIRLKLARGDKIIESAALSFYQKLVVVDALDVLPDDILSSLRGLNKLRNQCAHELGKVISEADLIRLGSPLGKFFTKVFRDSGYDPLRTLHSVVSYVVGFLTASCHVAEEAATQEPRQPGEVTANTKPKPQKSGKKPRSESN